MKRIRRLFTKDVDPPAVIRPLTIEMTKEVMRYSLVDLETLDVPRPMDNQSSDIRQHKHLSGSLRWAPPSPHVCKVTGPGHMISISLPSSPLTGGVRRPLSLSRMCVEAALLRTNQRLQVSPSPQVRAGSRYCQLTPCTCCKCPSAPPLEHTYLRTDGGRAPETGHNPETGRLYPSLSLWSFSSDPQV